MGKKLQDKALAALAYFSMMKTHLISLNCIVRMKNSNSDFQVEILLTKCLNDNHKIGLEISVEHVVPFHPSPHKKER